jgi:hypothetical protein
LHPINSDFDLYSKGKDGDSAAPLTASRSQDDIIRATTASLSALPQTTRQHAQRPEGVVEEVGEGFIVLGGRIRIAVSSRVRPEGLGQGALVTVTARLRGAEWVAEHIRVQ